MSEVITKAYTTSQQVDAEMSKENTGFKESGFTLMFEQYMI